jgi:broad specificity phosphatase PhoE
MTEPLRKEYAKLRRRPFLMPLWLTVTAAILALVIAGWTVAYASTTMVFVLRHAETAAGAGEDPWLSVAGELRAQRLAALFDGRAEGLVLDGVIVDGTRRAQGTVRPLTAAFGIPVTVAPQDPAVAARRALDEHGGGRVLIVADAAAIPGIVQALSGVTVRAPADTDYGVLYVVARPRFSRSSVSLLSLD